jgi:leader peptidase (prepilin peptidase)/N-methyltransferase
MDIVLLYILVAVLGLVFGSFANVLIHRIPREIPLGLFKNQRSACPQCGKRIAWYHNIPLFSYFQLKAKSACCKKPIAWRYPLVEFLCLFFSVLTFHFFLQSREWDLYNWHFYAQLLFELYFVYCLVVIIFIDLDFRIIPDRFSVGNWLVALVYVFAFQESWVEFLLGGVFGAGIFFLLAWGYEKWKGVEGLGMGDVKMMGWLGTWLGFSAVPLLVLLASASGLLVGLWAMRKSKDGLQTAIPFGPFLALGAYLAWLFQNLQGLR